MKQQLQQAICAQLSYTLPLSSNLFEILIKTLDAKQFIQIILQLFWAILIESKLKWNCLNLI